MKYKNISTTKQALIGYGEVEAGASIETQEEVFNPNFSLVVDESKKEETKTTKNSK